LFPTYIADFFFTSCPHINSSNALNEVGAEDNLEAKALASCNDMVIKSGLLAHNMAIKAVVAAPGGGILAGHMS